MSAVREIQVGIIGCGGIANGKHLPSLSKLAGVRLVAFCDLIPERAEAAKAKYGTEDARVYVDYRDLLSQKGVEVVHVLTPNSSHAEITVAALEAGMHVMCEKPMATSVAQARQMLDAARRTGRKLTIGYQNRFRPEVRYLKQCCDNGDLGDIYYARALAVRRRAVPTWGVFLDAEKQGGGPLIDIGTHALDMTLWCMNDYAPEMVVGSVYHKLGDRENSANLWGPWDPKQFTVEDSAFGFVRMKSGATIYLEASWALNTLLVDEGKCVLCGTEGGADLLGPHDAPLRLNGERYSRMYETIPSVKAGGVDYFEGLSDSPELAEAKVWIDHVREDKPLLTLPEQALVVTQILEMIYRSAAEGKPVFC